MKRKGGESDDDEGAAMVVASPRSPRSQSSSKQARVREDGFSEGAIYRLRLHNFMTYTDAEIFPGPRLNVILGPNGTGKSSIVCAIGLVLGGKPKILGRGKFVSAFVKSNTQSGWVEIELIRGNRNLIIRREIFMNNSSQYYIGKKPVSEAEVLKEVASLNVQVNNLCQFLPQDRVKEFAKMTPVQLLKETERAVGSERMLQLHERLEELQKERTRLAREESQMVSRVNALKAANEALEGEVARYNQRKELQDRAELLKQKLAWAKVAARKEEKDAADVAVKKQFDAVVALRERLDPHSGEVKELEASIKACKEDVNRLKREQREADRKRTAVQDELSKLLGEYEGYLEELSNADQAREEAEKDLQRARQDAAKIEHRIKELPAEGNTEPEMKRITAEMEKTERAARDAATASKNLYKEDRDAEEKLRECQAALSRVKDDREKREERLRNVNFQVYELWRWVRDQEAKGRFSGRVFDPVCLDIIPVDGTAAAMLEKVIPKATLCCFAVENDGDGNMIRKQAKTMRAVGFQIYKLDHVPRDERELAAQFPPTQHRENLRDYGATGWASELFTASPVTRATIFATAGHIRHTAYATSEVKAESLERFPDLAGCIDPQSYFMFKRSRYGNRDVVSQVVPYQLNARLLLAGSDAEQRNRLEAAVANAQHTLDQVRDRKTKQDSELATLKAELQALNVRKTELKNIPATRKALQARLESKRKEVRTMEAVDHNAAPERCRKRMAELRPRAEGKLAALLEPVRAAVEASMEIDGCIVRQSELEQQLRVLETRLADEQRELRDAERELDSCKERLAQAKRLMEAAKVDAKRLVVITAELQQKFASIPQSTPAAIEQELANVEQQASAIFAMSDEDLRRYEQRKREEKEKEEELASMKDNLENMTKELTKMSVQWLRGVPREDAKTDAEFMGLRKLVEKISDLFEAYMAEINCRGKVILHQPDDDYANYAIQIHVSFRASDTETQILSADFHSGGERSVSTMMYLIALQPLTPAPFRLVDEINQAMDPVNERRIWEQVVRAAASPTVPQYFLVTPKLLQDLTYTQDMVVLVVFNGLFNLTQSQWDESLRLLLAGEAY